MSEMPGASKFLIEVVNSYVCLTDNANNWRNWILNIIPAARRRPGRSSADFPFCQDAGEMRRLTRMELTPTKVRCNPEFHQASDVRISIPCFELQ